MNDSEWATRHRALPNLHATTVNLLPLINLKFQTKSFYVHHGSPPWTYAMAKITFYGL